MEAVAVLAGLLSAISATFLLSVFYRSRRERWEAPATLDDKIKTMADSLRTAAETVSDIEQEIEARQELVTKLEEDAAMAEALAELHSDQVEAITTALDGRLEAANEKTFKRSVWIAVAGIVAGAGITVLVTVLLT